MVYRLHIEERIVRAKFTKENNMSSMLRFKVYDQDGVYQAATNRPEEAGAIVALLGDGSVIKDGQNNRRIVWREGAEAQPAGESYDVVANTVYSRC